MSRMRIGLRARLSILGMALLAPLTFQTASPQAVAGTGVRSTEASAPRAEPAFPGATPGIPYREAQALTGAPRILIAHTMKTDLLPLLADLDLNDPSVALCDTFDLEMGTPTLAELSAYDVVFVSTNWPILDAGALGDRLADFVDMGGRVVLTMSSWIDGYFPWDVAGRFASGGYHPFVPADTRTSVSKSLGSFDASHPLMSGVSTLSVMFSSSPAPAQGTYVVASWDDGSPAVAVKGNVVALNVLPQEGYVSGDRLPIFSNAVRFLMTPRLRVLVTASEFAYPTKLVNELVRDPLIGAVDYIDATSATPTLAQIARYDAVIAYPNVPFFDPVAMGDRLADYVDIGGKVIVAPFSWWYVSHQIQGRFAADGYNPLLATLNENHYTVANLGAFDGSHPIMQNVTTASTEYRDYTALAPGAASVALWDDGEYCVATRGDVVAINGYLGEGGTSFTGDLALMARNAVKYLVLVSASLDSISSSSGSAPFTFTCTGSATGGQPPYTYLWDFADGSSSPEQNPTHTYDSPGSYLVTLTATDSVGHEGSLGFYVSVGAALSNFVSRTPASGMAPLGVSFTSAPTGGTPPYTHDWNWGDGTAHGTAQSLSHTFATAGVFTTVLTVTDAAGHSVNHSLTTTVLPTLAAYSGGGPISGNAPLTVFFNGFAAGGTPPYTWAWTFGDGSSAATQAPYHAYSAAGTYSANLTVTDAALRTASAAPLQVTVTVPPPVISSLTKKGSPFRIVVAGTNLQSGIQVYINGTPWSNVTYQSSSQITLKGGSALKAAVPPGTPTQFRFVNPDTGETTVTWSY